MDAPAVRHFTRLASATSSSCSRLDEHDDQSCCERDGCFWSEQWKAYSATDVFTQRGKDVIRFDQRNETDSWNVCLCVCVQSRREEDETPWNDSAQNDSIVEGLREKESIECKSSSRLSQLVKSTSFKHTNNNKRELNHVTPNKVTFGLWSVSKHVRTIDDCTDLVPTSIIHLGGLRSVWWSWNHTINNWIMTCQQEYLAGHLVHRFKPKVGQNGSFKNKACNMKTKPFALRRLRVNFP